MSHSEAELRQDQPSGSPALQEERTAHQTAAIPDKSPPALEAAQHPDSLSSPEVGAPAGQSHHNSPTPVPPLNRYPWWRRWVASPRTILRAILMLDDTPHSIALGTAVGMFIGMTPTVGIQMILVMIFALLTSRLFQFNRVAALLTVYISNPLTVVPIYWIDYKVGALLVGGDFSLEDLRAVLDYEGLAGWWQTIKTLFIEVGEPLILGSLVVGTLAAVVTYPTILWLLRRFRRQGVI